jgi:hypothetical protein
LWRIVVSDTRENFDGVEKRFGFSKTERRRVNTEGAEREGRRAQR